MAQAVETDQIDRGDMVLYRGSWYMVKNITRYYNGMTDDIQLRIREDRYEWVPVTELRDIEKRPTN